MTRIRQQYIRQLRRLQRRLLLSPHLNKLQNPDPRQSTRIFRRKDEGTKTQTNLPINQRQNTRRLQLLIRPIPTPPCHLLTPNLKTLPRLQRNLLRSLSLLKRFPRPMHMPRLSLPHKRDKIIPSGAQRHMQQPCNDLETGGKLQVGEVLRHGLGDLDHGELFKAEVFGYEEDFLAVLVRSEDFGAFADDEDAEVGVEEAEEVVCVGDNVTGGVLI